MVRQSNADLAQENYLTFCRWREGKGLDDFIRYIQRRKDGDVYRYTLSRSKINNELKIGSAINQNPGIRTSLFDIERDMRAAGLLLPDEPIEPLSDDVEGAFPSKDMPPIQGGLSAADRRRLNELEEENAYLREELKKKDAALERYGLIDRFLTDTMRMPR